MTEVHFKTRGGLVLARHIRFMGYRTDGKVTPHEDKEPQNKNKLRYGKDGQF